MIPMLEALHRLRARVLPRVQPDPPVRCFVVVCLSSGERIDEARARGIYARRAPRCNLPGPFGRRAIALAELRAPACRSGATAFS
jgi:hypothetical protein